MVVVVLRRFKTLETSSKLSRVFFGLSRLGQNSENAKYPPRIIILICGLLAKARLFNGFSFTHDVIGVLSYFHTVSTDSQAAFFRYDYAGPTERIPPPS
jgi:hypothetical protein